MDLSTLPRLALVAPDSAQGWTHVWDGGTEQVPLDDDQATILTLAGMIYWSGIHDPPSGYRVYRLRDGHTLDDVKGALNV